jgi:hypothetical protein
MRRTTDEQSYSEKLTRQVGPGAYFVDRPRPDNIVVIPSNVYIHPQGTGVPVSKALPPVSIESDLRGLGRPLGREARAAIRGSRSHHNIETSPITFESTIDTPIEKLMSFVSGGRQAGVIPPVDVPGLTTNPSRLDLPAAGLRGKYPNRFEPVLFHNPAETAFAPFDREVSSRIMMKDQWRVPKTSLTAVNPPTVPGLLQ